MSFFSAITHVLFTSGLSKREYDLIENKLNADNREKLASGICIVSVCMVIMLFLSLLVESIAHSRLVYLVSLAFSVLLSFLSKLGRRNPAWSTLGIYLFSAFAFFLGIYQGIFTSPQEQTASFMALIVAVPFWFCMIPIRMISWIYLFTGIFIAGCIHFKTGYVQTADIVNSLIYSTASAIISTYATCVKCKRFYAEHLTDQIGRTDMLTGLGNRNAFAEHTEQYAGKTLPEDLTVICLDVNELKIINDTMGHHVGDDLLRGAADCITTSFNIIGTCYRTGGDEFIVIAHVERERLQTLCRLFERRVGEWKCSWGRPLRISYGCASAWELPGESFSQISKLADNRLYEAKSIYYSTCGIDRRGHQEAYSALCESYIKILLVNLTQNSCKVIRTEPGDPLWKDSASASFSQWMQLVSTSGQVHPEDMAEYTRKTDLQFLRDHFRAGNKTVHIFYRRKEGNGYQHVMTELMPAREYTDEQQIVYLYVKNIDHLD